MAALLSFRRRDRAHSSFRRHGSGGIPAGDRPGARRRRRRRLRWPIEEQIVHRDVKPANLLLDNRRKPASICAISGWGAILTSRRREQMRDGAGTPIYMAPERLLMFAADEIKCDIYSMGVTLFEALLLEKPFRVPAHVGGPSVAPYLATVEPKPVRRLDPDFRTSSRPSSPQRWRATRRDGLNRPAIWLIS